MKWLKEYWFIISALITYILIPVATFLIGNYKSKIKKLKEEEIESENNMELLKEALKTIHKNSLYKSCEDFLNRGYSPMYAKQTLQEQYNSYHKLGGDTFITDMVRRVNDLPNNKDGR